MRKQNAEHKTRNTKCGTQNEKRNDGYLGAEISVWERGRIWIGELGDSPLAPSYWYARPAKAPQAHTHRKHTPPYSSAPNNTPSSICYASRTTGGPTANTRKNNPLLIFIKTFLGMGRAQNHLF